MRVRGRDPKWNCNPSVETSCGLWGNRGGVRRRGGLMKYRKIGLDLCYTNVYNSNMVKMGRPLAVGKIQSKLIALRLTAAEFRALEHAAKSAGASVSEYIRQKLGFRSRP